MATLLNAIQFVKWTSRTDETDARFVVVQMRLPQDPTQRTAPMTVSGDDAFQRIKRFCVQFLDVSGALRAAIGDALTPPEVAILRELLASARAGCPYSLNLRGWTFCATRDGEDFVVSGRLFPLRTLGTLDQTALVQCAEAMGIPPTAITHLAPTGAFVWRWPVAETTLTVAQGIEARLRTALPGVEVVIGEPDVPEGLWSLSARNGDEYVHLRWGEGQDGFTLTSGPQAPEIPIESLDGAMRKALAMLTPVATVDALVSALGDVSGRSRSAADLRYVAGRFTAALDCFHVTRWFLRANGAVEVVPPALALLPPRPRVFHLRDLVTLLDTLAPPGETLAEGDRAERVSAVVLAFVAGVVGSTASDA